ncbi:hypothetical protein [Sphingomonas sp. CROZ-RG-20F-R02-07]|uniref:hypothetical protein n=1 Tax=Sphingomonas sp. CROZ-RG-20F-R02-07 TaxID=2914832 RepID=UPI001F5ABD31|nr:hypothetical protein [Sphingomonas sp. CROZ-RG-20F-R02-07]
MEDTQLASGEVPVLMTTDPEMRRGCVADPSVFPTAVILTVLADVPAAAGIAERARAFLLGEMDGDGLWKHWTRDHPYHCTLPPDLDDSACASTALLSSGEVPDNRQILLANRRGDGLFLTWVIPRLRWTTRRHRMIMLRQLRHLPVLVQFFRLTSARRGDVDAVVNANCLFYLQDFVGREHVVRYLVSIIVEGREAASDKWYDNPFVVRYFIARAIATAAPERCVHLVAPLTNVDPMSALDIALAIGAARLCGAAVPPAWIARLVELQIASGAWPIAAVYHGGRRWAGRGFDPPHPNTPHWGSEQMTTAFCIAALWFVCGEV